MTAGTSLGDDLRSLYQGIILDHGKSPRNFRVMEHYTCRVQGKNPMCGDKIVVTAKLDVNERLEDIAFEGKGCAISIASASMMTETLKGRSIDAMWRLSKAVHGLCKGEFDANEAKALLSIDLASSIDKLASLSGVRQFPVRVKCATLPWHALASCIEGKTQATTE